MATMATMSQSYVAKLYPEHMEFIISIKICINTEPDLDQIFSLKRAFQDLIHDLNKSVINKLPKGKYHLLFF